MGKAQSKRSIDITTEVKKDNVEEVTGKMEKIEDVDQLKPQVNGDTHHNDNELTEKVTEEGTENEKDLSTEKEQKPHIEVAGGGDDGGEMNTDENKTCENGDDETLNESKTTGETSSSVTEDGDSSKKTKKEKGKKKWSFRSISFGRKDKQKPTKKEEGAAVNGECEKVPEETTEDPAAAQKEQTKDEVKSVEATTETTTTTAAAPTPVEDKPATITDTAASKPEEKSAAPPAPAQQPIPPATNPTEPAKEDISKTPETITTAESNKTEVVEPPTVSNGTEETTKKDEAAKPLEEEAPKECVTETPPAKIEVKDVKTDVNVAVDQSVQKSESQKGDGDSDIAQNLSPPPLPSTLPPSQVMVFALSDTEKPSDAVQQVVAPAPVTEQPTEKISEPEPKVEKPTEQPKPDSVGEKPTEQPKPDSVGEKPTEQPKLDSVVEKPAEQPKPDSVGEKPAELPEPPASTSENIVAAPVAEPAAEQVPADSAKVISSEEKKTEVEEVVDVQKVAEVSAEPKSSESVGDNKPKEIIQEQAAPTEEVKQKEVGDAVLLPPSEAPKEEVLPKSEDGTNVPVAEEKKVIDQLLLGKTVKLEGEINPDQIAQTIALIDEVTQEAASITQQKLESDITQSPAPPTEEKPASQEVKEGAQPEIPKPVEIETTSCNAPNPPTEPAAPENTVSITNTQLPPVVAPSPVEEKVEKVEEKKDETVAKTEVVSDSKQAIEQQKEEDKKPSEAVDPKTESQQIEQKPEAVAAVGVEQTKKGTEESKVTAEIKKDEPTTKADTAAAEGAKVQPVSSTAASKENGVGENHEVIEHKTIEDVKSEQQTDKKLEKMPETTPGIVEVAE